MAYVFKVILRAENHEFIYCLNKQNSASAHVLAIDRKTKESLKDIFVISTKKWKYTLVNKQHFKESTINRLEEIVKRICAK